MTPARKSAITAQKRQMGAAFAERDVLCSHCRQWVRRDTTHMVSIGNGRGRIQCRHHPAPAIENP